MNHPAIFTNTPERVRLRVEDFEMLEAGGAFADYVKAELIDGDVYVMNAQFARHGIAKGRLYLALMKWLENTGSNLYAYSEVSLRLEGDSMPEPDLFLAPRQGFGSVPVSGVALAIEVSHSTLRIDLGRKAELYGGAGIPEYWVVDVETNRVVIHTNPGADGYATRGEVPFGEPLAARTITGLELGVVAFVDDGQEPN